MNERKAFTRLSVEIFSCCSSNKKWDNLSFFLFWTKEKHKARLAWIATEQLAATGTAFISQQTAAICLIKVMLRLNIYNTTLSLTLWGGMDFSPEASAVVVCWSRGGALAFPLLHAVSRRLVLNHHLIVYVTRWWNAYSGKENKHTQYVTGKRLLKVTSTKSGFRATRAVMRDY